MTKIKVNILQEAGYEMALLGLSFNKNQPLDKMPEVLKKLADKDKGHNKALEFMYLWVDVKASRAFWQEADTYRIASKQSESTMHTMLKRELTQLDFDMYLPEAYLDVINSFIQQKNLNAAKKLLPEGFLQRRLWCMNYKTLRNIIEQRSTHKLPEWTAFIQAIYKQVKHPELLPKIKETKHEG